MKKTIEVKGNFLLGNEYWEWVVNVHVRFGEVWDSDIVWAKGAGPDDETLELTEVMEDYIKEAAELRAREEMGDIFSLHYAEAK